MAIHSPLQKTVIAALPKAELHLHLEGSIAPATAVALAARHGVAVAEAEVVAKYSYHDFSGFLEAFKWVTSFVTEPPDYALVTEGLVDELLRQNVVYAEVIVSCGIMLRRQQDVAANFEAIRKVAERARARGLRLQWIFDATRQFGVEPAGEVARWAVRLREGGVVAMGMGGDELALPAESFRRAYDIARDAGLHSHVHAGEVGGPQSIREAIEFLGAERIGHGIAAMLDPALMDWMAARGMPVENCPTSNICTGALARQLGRAEANLAQHPLPEFMRKNMRVVLSTDDPAMFHTDLMGEYEVAARLGLSTSEILRLARMSFESAFLPLEERSDLLQTFDSQAISLGLE
ncbi:MAG: adenosine deaminase [Candidatus Acidiferrales bacterium]